MKICYITYKNNFSEHEISFSVVKLFAGGSGNYPVLKRCLFQLIEGSGKNAGGVGNSAGRGTVEGSSNAMNRPSHHKYKIPKQFELKQS